MKVDVKAILVTVFILFTVLTTKSIASEWTKEDTVRQLFFSVALANDWRQTAEISRTWYRREKNPILGSKPSGNDVNWYFASCLAGHYLISRLLPSDYRKAWQYAWIAIQTTSIENNNGRGLEKKISFEYRFQHTIRF